MTDAAADARNAGQIEYWNSRAGQRWVAMQSSLDAAFAPITEAAMAFAAAQAGERVVDVGCGCGATVLELARRVGPTGAVLGVDISQPMLDLARRRAAELPQVSLELADAATRGFGAEADLLFSRFGVMFFDDPVAAFTNLRRALKPGGRLALAVWRPLAENPWMNVPLAAIRPLLPDFAPSDPDLPGPFGLARPERLTAILTSAGFSGMTLQPLDTQLRLPATAEEAAIFATQMGPVGRALAEADPALLPRATEAVTRALAGYQEEDGVRIGGAIWLVAARA